MPAFTYAGDHDRYYPTLGITPEPGEVHDLDADPGDGRWTPAPPADEPVEQDTPAPATPAKGKAATTTKEG